MGRPPWSARKSKLARMREAHLSKQRIPALLVRAPAPAWHRGVPVYHDASPGAGDLHILSLHRGSQTPRQNKERAQLAGIVQTPMGACTNKCTEGRQRHACVAPAAQTKCGCGTNSRDQAIRPAQPIPNERYMVLLANQRSRAP